MWPVGCMCEIPDLGSSPTSLDGLPLFLLIFIKSKKEWARRRKIMFNSKGHNQFTLSGKTSSLEKLMKGALVLFPTYGFYGSISFTF